MGVSEENSLNIKGLTETLGKTEEAHTFFTNVFDDPIFDYSLKVKHEIKHVVRCFILSRKN